MGTITGRRATAGLGVALVALVLAGCVGDRSEPTTTDGSTGPGAPVAGHAEADLTGVVALRDGTPTLGSPSDTYYEGMALDLGEPVVQAADGTTLVLADLRDGDTVALRVDSWCAESYPVQCQVHAVTVTDRGPAPTA